MKKKPNYKINGDDVKNISAWCKQNGVKRSKIASLFYKAKHPTKKQQLLGVKPSKVIHYGGWEIVKRI